MPRMTEAEFREYQRKRMSPTLCVAQAAATKVRLAKTQSQANAFVEACFAAKLPVPTPEYRFNPDRRWRFDYAWIAHCVALEVQGGIWTMGRHTRGAALLKEWEKLNAAAVLGWRILYCQPSDLLSTEMVETVRKAISV